MPAEITMPQLSDTMAEGTVVKWHKKEGDKVKAGEEIADIETDKATMPMEAFEPGTLALIAAPEGAKVKVGDRIAVLATGSENVEDVRRQFAGAAAAPSAPMAQRSPEPVAASVTSVESASVRDAEVGREPIEGGREAARQQTTQSAPTQTPERVSQEATAAFEPHHGGDGNHDHGGHIRISPLARRMARDRGIDLSRIHGSGPGGRIVQQDVLAIAEGGVESATAQPSAPKAVAEVAPRIGTGQKQVIPLSKIRAVIAQRLQQAKQTIPHIYESIDIDLEEVVQLRQRMNKQLEGEQVRLSLADFITKATAAALRQHPVLNSTFDGQQITQWGDVNMGLAVSLSEGLIVPVLRSADQMGLREIRVRSADLIDRARKQRLRQEEMTGATFTITSLGTYGLREFSAIINPPSVAILAVAAAQKRAVVSDEQVVARTMLTVTLSCDHRVVDGAPAAEFLRTLKGLLEEPGMMLA